MPKTEDFLQNAEAIVLLLELIASSREPLRTESVLNIIQRIADIALHPVNRRSLASYGLVGAILKLFGSKSRDSTPVLCTDSDTISCSEALVLPSHPLQPLLIRLLVSVASYKITPGELTIWENEMFQGLESGVSESMLRALVGVTCGNDGVAGTYSLFPHVSFECSSVMSEGYGCLKIPSMISPSCSSWPPPNGYSFAAWIRIDKFDNSSLESNYQTTRSANKCLICEDVIRNPMKYSNCQHEFCSECVGGKYL
jgi:hypothetical protein